MVMVFSLLLMVCDGKRIYPLACLVSGQLLLRAGRDLSEFEIVERRPRFAIG
jgi:hypothetical protein